MWSLVILFCPKAQQLHRLWADAGAVYRSYGSTSDFARPGEDRHGHFFGPNTATDYFEDARSYHVTSSGGGLFEARDGSRLEKIMDGNNVWPTSPTILVDVIRTPEFGGGWGTSTASSRSNP